MKMENNEENKAEQSAGDTNAGSKPQELELIKRANEAAERLEEANKKQEELLRRQEELAAETALGGRANAGMIPPKPAELTPQEYAEKVRSGLANPLKDDGFI